ncbi:MAG TPA: DUF2723 domain-containing protein [Flavobacteriales bacterium]|jgi:hypothetical protein|nr:DUF2723 domain-containing protein [Flavobacteriales bacterium]
MDFRRLNIIGGWFVFAIAMFTYGSTVEPTTSFWDCGEYIATSYKMEVGHPPGAPTYLLMARLVSMFSPTDQVAYMVNMLSAVSSALTIMFLFWTITYLALKLIKGEEMSRGNTIAVLGSSLLGSLAFTFSDTFWFSAVEGEVYATSSFMTALVFWAILKWESVSDEPHSNRWLIFIWFIIGISIGVHLLNLLAIPAIIFVYYFKKFTPSRKGIVTTLLVSVGILGFVQLILIPQIVNFSAKFELLFTNGFGLPFNTGSTVFGIILISAIVFGLYYSQKKNKVLMNTILLSFTVLFIGYLSFGIILIRSNANPPIDENNPENMVNLLSYLERKQYGDIPLLYGQYFNSPLDNREPYKDGTPLYYPDQETGKYEIADDQKGALPNYASEFMGFFPRMWSAKNNHVRAYKAWSGFEGKPRRYRSIVSGKEEIINKPTFGENISYFVRYQLWWMWGRYFAWNFIGRQNDSQGHRIDSGKLIHGNMYSGIPFIDSMYLGNMEYLPDELKNNKSRNTYFFLPFLIGLIGLYFQYKYDKNNTWVVFLLFAFTGIAIAVYLNMYPYQPRERDYAFVGSFYTFAIWIGLAVIGLYRALREKISGIALPAGITAIGLLAAPFLMASQNWDDHNRSHRYTAREMARNYLDSCDENAILFTNGDNDTFPLWYLQEVEGYRTDVRVVNLMLLNTGWYIEQMARKAYDGEGIPINMSPDVYREGKRTILRFMEDKRLDQDKHYNLKTIVDYVTDDSKMVTLSNGERTNVIPARKIKIPVDREKVIANGTVPPRFADQIVDEVRFEAKGRYILKNNLMVWAMLANFNWDRPIYFSVTMSQDAFYGLEDYFIQEGFAYRLIPVKTEKNGFRDFGAVNSEKMYERLVQKFNWGGYENPDLWMDENNKRFITNIRFTMGRLAEELVNQGDTARAKETLDKCVEVTVNENFPYNGTLASIIEQYYRLGEKEKANDLLMKTVENERQYLQFAFSQDPEDTRRMKSVIRQSLSMIGQATMYVSEQYPQDESIKKEVNDIYTEYVTLYQSEGLQ